MQTQIENTDTNTETHANAKSIASLPDNPVAKRLARMPHVIELPAQTPEPRELKRLIEARIAELNAQQPRLNRRNDDEGMEFSANKLIISILDQHMDDLRRLFPEIDTPPIPSTPTITRSAPVPLIPSAELAGKNKSDPTEPGEPAIQPQQHSTEPEVSRTEPQPSRSDLGSLSTEPPVPNQNHSADSDTDLDKQFAEALKKIPEGLHQIAADLYESIHHRSKLAKLASVQRYAIYELNKTWDTESILQIISMPPPVGIGFRSSLAGLKRFLQDYRRILRDEQNVELESKTEEQRLAIEQSFETANASDESFRQAAERQIRKRLFITTADPGSDYHEIRWLLKSLELLRKAQS